MFFLFEFFLSFFLGGVMFFRGDHAVTRLLRLEAETLQKGGGPGAKQIDTGIRLVMVFWGPLKKWRFPTMVGLPNKPMGFPTKNDHFGVFGGYHHLRKHPNTLNLSSSMPGKNITYMNGQFVW